MAGRPDEFREMLQTSTRNSIRHFHAEEWLVRFPHVGITPRRQRQPQERRQPRRARQADPVRDEITTLASRGLTSPEIAASVGIEGRAVRHVIERNDLAEQARIDLLAELNVDPQTLSMSAQARLAVATRVVERRLAAEHAERMRGIEEDVRQRVLAQTATRLTMLQEMEREAQESEAYYRRQIDGSAGPRPPPTRPMTTSSGVACTPDDQRLAATRSEAFRLFNDKKETLTGAR